MEKNQATIEQFMESDEIIFNGGINRYKKRKKDVLVKIESANSTERRIYSIPIDEWNNIIDTLKSAVKYPNWIWCGYRFKETSKELIIEYDVEWDRTPYPRFILDVNLVGTETCGNILYPNFKKI